MRGSEVRAGLGQYLIMSDPDFSSEGGSFFVVQDGDSVPSVLGWW